MFCAGFGVLFQRNWTSNQNFACFVRGFVYYFKVKLYEKLKMQWHITILVGPSVLALLIITNCILHVLIDNSRTAGSTKILKLFCVSETIFFSLIISFFKQTRVNNFWDSVQNMFYLGLKCSSLFAIGKTYAYFPMPLVFTLKLSHFVSFVEKEN